MICLAHSMYEAGDRKKEVSRIYAKGFYDGQRAAGIEDQPMNSARLNDIERGLSGVARKVLAAVPILGFPLTAKDINAECIRQGHHIDRRTVDGCLSALRDSGLIREPEHGLFTRVAPKQSAPIVSVVKSSSEIPKHLLPAKPEQEKREPLETLASIADTLRAQARIALEMADQIEAVGIGFADQIKNAQTGGEKLKQLQDLLKSIQS